MSRTPRLDEDWHVHSTFSDGTASIPELASVAVERGLGHLTIVDHVRRDSDYIPAWLTAVAEVRERYQGRLTIATGVEAKLLNQDGDLDIPESLDGVDYVYIADHRPVFGKAAPHPKELRARLEAGEVSSEDVFVAIADAYEGALGKSPRPAVIAHLFSVLPKLGLDEADVPMRFVDRIAGATIRARARVEIDERWKCPGWRVVSRLMHHGVPIVASTDAHRAANVGRYRFVAEVMGTCEAAA